MMKNRGAKVAAFTLAEITVVIVILGVLVALLLPAIIKGRKQAQAALARTTINNLSMGLDAFERDFGFYPPTVNAYNPTTGQFDGLPYGDFGYSEALVQCLCNRFTKGAGDTPSVVGVFNVFQGRNKVMGFAPVTTSAPYLEVKASDLTDRDGDGFPEYADPWGNPYIYVPKSDYFLADGVTYKAGALEATPNPPGPDPSAIPPNAHCQRFKFQLISIGPDGWTPGLSITLKNGYKYFDITLTGNPYPPLNPALIGSDVVLVAPAIDPVLGHRDGTADDINNWSQ